MRTPMQRRFSPELYCLIFDMVRSRADLANIRLTCKIFSRLITRRVFRVFTFTSFTGGARMCRDLQSRSDLAIHVEEVIFREDGIWGFGGDVYDANMSPVSIRDGHDLMEDTVECFRWLNMFPRLKYLLLEFHSDFEEYDPWDIPEIPSITMQLQLAVLRTLSTIRRPPHLEELSLYNVIAAPNDLFESVGFRALMAPIKKFTITVISPDDGYESAYVPFIDFWSKTLKIILESAVSVEYLVITSDVSVLSSVYDKDWGVVQLPNLRSLVLKNIIFLPSEQHGALSFILCHRKTMKELCLINCKLALENRQYPEMLWSSIWYIFQEKMRLNKFVSYSSSYDDPPFEHFKDKDLDICVQHYSDLREDGTTDLEQPPEEWKERDLSVLHNLLITVEYRQYIYAR